MKLNFDRNGTCDYCGDKRTVSIAVAGENYDSTNSNRLICEDCAWDMFGQCMECGEYFDRNELTWINDNYGIPYKKVCEGCYDKVESWIRSNNYGDELSHDELYGED